MALYLSAAVRAARVNAIKAQIDSGSGPGMLKIYTGYRPYNLGSATGTLLAELVFSDPCAPDSTDGILTMSAITSDLQANANGYAGWFRVLNSSSVVLFDGTIGSDQYSGDMVISNQNIVANQLVACPTFVLVDGNIPQ